MMSHQSASLDVVGVAGGIRVVDATLVGATRESLVVQHVDLNVNAAIAGSGNVTVADGGTAGVAEPVAETEHELFAAVAVEGVLKGAAGKDKRIMELQ